MNQLALNLIRTDGGTQPRAQIDMMVVLEYSQAMQEGATFPPVIVFYDGSEYWLADGFHRFNAAMQLEQITIDADVRQGTRRDAVLYSVGANSQHGLRRSNADKRRAVETLLRDEEWAKWSNREISRQCGVVHEFVARVRNEVSGYRSQIETVAERNGTIYTMDTANVGHSQPTTLDFYKKLDSNPTERASLADIFDPVAQTIPTAYLPKPVYQTPVYHAPEPVIDEEENEDDWEIEPSIEETKEAPHNPLSIFTPLPEPIIPVRSNGVPAALQSSESNEWYTPSRYIEAARELMGGIDTDPASNELANQTVQAMLYYDAKSNGLNRIWIGRVWLNPPYGFTDGKSNQEIWTQKLFQELERGSCYEAVLLVNANTEAKWFQPLYDYLICFTDHRIRFYNATGDSSQPTQGNALIYFGRKPEQQERFKQIFRQFGRIGQFN